jgi:hypothetical protein
VPGQATDANDDTYQALELIWQKALQDPLFPQTFRDLIRAGRLRSLEGQNLAPPGIDPPYAHMLVEKGKANERNTGLSYFDYRNVTITLVGQKADVSSALPQVIELFHRYLMPADLAYLANLPASQTGSKKYYTLTYPYYSPRKFFRWWSLNDGELVQDEATKKGKDVWRGVLVGEITSVMIE